MQVLLLPLLIVRMILSIIMSLMTMSFLSRTDRRMQQTHASLHPLLASQSAANGITGKGLAQATGGIFKGLFITFMGLVLVGIVITVLTDNSQHVAPTEAAAAPTASATTASNCPAGKHHRIWSHHRWHRRCDVSAEPTVPHEAP